MNSRIAAPLAIAMLMAAAPAKASPQSSVTAGGAVELPAEFGEFAGDHEASRIISERPRSHRLRVQAQVHPSEDWHDVACSSHALGP